MVGEIVSHYKIIEKLGGGGMGIVYKAHDLKLDRFVALKFLPPALSLDEESKSNIINEAKIAAKLDHPNICTIHEVGETEEGQVFISMSLYEGETLKKAISKNKLNNKTKEEIILQIANGIEHAHQHGIVHRDIKPANIFLTNNNEVKILDFGVAKLEGDFSVLDAEKVKGTIAYMSPEQISGKEVDYRTDIWAFGVLVFELISGVKPFSSLFEQSALYSIINDEPDYSNIELNNELAYLKRTIEKCLKKDKKDRFENFHNIISLLETKSSKFIQYKNYRLVTSLIISAFIGTLIILAVLNIIPIKGLFSDTHTGNIRVAILPFTTSFNNESISESSLLLQTFLVDNIINCEKISVIDPISLNGLIVNSAGISDINRKINISEILADLGVNYYLKGNIQQLTDKKNIQSSLIRIGDDEIIFSANYSFVNDNEMSEAGELISRKLLDYFQIKTMTKGNDKDVQPFTLGTNNISALKYFLVASEYNYRVERDEVKKFLELAIDSDPKYISPRIWLVSTLFYMGNIEEASKQLDTAKALVYKANRYEQIMISWAEALLNNDIIEQINALKIALEYIPNNNIATYQLAYLYYIQGNYGAAVTRLQKTVEMKWNYSGAYNLMGLCLVKLQNYYKAIEILENSLSIKPINEEIPLLLEIAYKQVNDQKTSKHFDSIYVSEMMSSGYTREAAYEYSAGVNLELGFYSDAISDYQNVLTINPSKIKLHEKMGDVCLAINDTNSAIIEYQSALASNDSFANVHLKLGEIYDVRKNYNLALSHYKKFVHSDTTKIREDIQARIQQLKGGKHDK